MMRSILPALGIVSVFAGLAFAGSARAGQSGLQPLLTESGDRVLCLGGPEWRIHDDPDGRGVGLGFPVAATDGAGWIPATVPGNIQGDLEAARLVHPIQYAVPDPRLYDMTCRDWWYRRDFVLPASFAGRRLTLVFDGVDHVCEVFLNGVRIGSNTGMFIPFQIDVTDAVAPGTNRLALRLEGLPEALRGRMEAATGMMDRLPFAHAVRRQYHALKSTINCGYDWSMPLHTLGIWKEVRLEATGPARIHSVWARTALLDDYTRADVKVRLEMNSTEAANADAVFVITGPTGTTTEAVVPATLTRGDQALEAVIPLANPALWWPNGQGEQPLYRLDVALTAGGQALDRRAVRFGVREIRWEQTEGAPPDFPIPWRLVVNGRPVRMMGSNLVPPDLLFGVTRDNGVHVIERAHAAGMNTLRVWGGGIILPPAMYDRADELGIMFSQEFPIANSEVERDEAFLGNLSVMAAAVVREVRNHPSLVEWSGGNEIPGKVWQDAVPPHPALTILREAVAAHDDRRMIATCPVAGGHHHWPYVVHLEANPPGAWGYGGGVNYFAGWNARDQMRFGEFATQSPAHHEVWQRVVPPPHRWPLDDPNDPVLFRKHVFRTAGAPNSWLHKADILDPTFGAAADMDRFVRSGQWLGAEGGAYAIDEIRRRGGRVGGFTTWLFNEPWPNCAGHYMLDHDGRPLMKYAFVRQALAPVALSLRHSGLLYDPTAGLDAQLWIVSDHPEPRTGLRWNWKAWDRRGTRFAQGAGDAQVHYRQASLLADLHLKAPAETANGPILVALRLQDADGVVLQERMHLFAGRGYGPFAGLLAGPNGADPDDDAAPSLDRPVRWTSLQLTERTWRIDDGREELALTLRNDGEMPALFCSPQPLLEYQPRVFVENDYISIPPGESRRIVIRAPASAAAALSLDQVGWQLRAFNAPAVLVAPSADVLLAVGRLDRMTQEFQGALSEADRAQLVRLLPLPNQPEAATVPYLVEGGGVAAAIDFEVKSPPTDGSLRLRLHTADRSADAPEVVVVLNDFEARRTVAAGYGVQKDRPAHLARNASLDLVVPATALRPGLNHLQVSVLNPAWFTWDAIHLTARERAATAGIAFRQTENTRRPMASPGDRR